LAEIEYGMEAKNWGASRRDLMHRFLARFTPLLPDTETARVWARIKCGSEKKGKPISFADAWIAAAAVQLNVPPATHNARDYAAVESLVLLTAATTP
jgi:predicted nucleic acid-binding protein